jgi:hypothetical protein
MSLHSSPSARQKARGEGAVGRSKEGGRRRERKEGKRLLFMCHVYSGLPRLGDLCYGRSLVT